MKETPLTKAIAKVVDLKMQSIDRIVKDLVEPLEAVGNPEQLIKKAYDRWTPEDLQLLTKIYGTGDKTPLTNLIFNREYAKVKQLEVEEV